MTAESSVRTLRALSARWRAKAKALKHGPSHGATRDYEDTLCADEIKVCADDLDAAVAALSQETPAPQTSSPWVCPTCHDPQCGDANPQETPALPIGDAFTQSFDAREWARAFVAHVKANPAIPTDENCMIGWFANAIMRGYDEYPKRLGSQETPRWQAEPDLLAVAKALDEYQREYERNTYDTMPGNSLWAGKAMVIVAAARAALASAHQAPLPSPPEGAQ